MRFTKMHGIGNDYIYFDCLEEELENPEEVSIRLSDRHTGVGGDGIVTKGVENTIRSICEVGREGMRDTDRKIIAFSCVLCAGIGAVMAAMSPLFTIVYNVTDEVKALAAVMIVVYAALMPFSSFAHNCYFTLRSGGKTLITFLFDSAYVWAISVPTGLLLSRFTTLPIVPLFSICVALELGKCIIGFMMLRSGKWAKKLV